MDVIRFASPPLRRVLAAATLTALAACSGGGGAGGLTPPTGGGGTAPGGGTPAGTAQVTFKMKWGGATSGSHLVPAAKPAYLPATARSVSVQITTAGNVTTGLPIVYLNSPTATITFTAPTGLDTFAVKVYDAQNGQGNVLSQADLTQTVSASKANIVAATLNGVISSLSVAIASTFTGGTKGVSVVNVTAIDADGNTIVGPGDYSTPIELRIKDGTQYAQPYGTANNLVLSRKDVAIPGTAVSLTYWGLPLVTGAASVVATAGSLSASGPISVTPGYYQYKIPTGPSSYPVGITLGPDGKIWFTESSADKIGSLAVSLPYYGSTVVFKEYPVPTANAGPQTIVRGSDGRLWFSETNANKIGAVTTAGAFSEDPTLFGTGDLPLGLVDRGDGTMWYTGFGADRLGYVSEGPGGGGGETTLPEAPTQVQPTGIAEGSDGYIYFSEAADGRIGRLHDLFGTVQEITVTAPSGSSTSPQLGQMVSGPDGNLWVVDTTNSQIDVISPNGFYVANQITTPTPGTGPTGITVGPDGALWFTESYLDRIARVTTGGAVTEYSLYTGAPGSKNLKLTDIAFGSDGSIYFTERNANAIGRLVP